jgi:hypothetical protein
MNRLLLTLLIVFFWIGFVLLDDRALVKSAPGAATPPNELEYLLCEAENMRGLTETPRHEPLLNPSYLDLPAAKAPGWSISGPGVSAEWTQGGESEWNSVGAAADETHGVIWQDVEIPRAGEYKLWVRYADWANKTETFLVRVTQEGREVARHEFGLRDVIDSHDEVSMYWGWAFTWDGSAATVAKGPARISIELDKASQARRQVDCVLLTSHCLPSRANNQSVKEQGRVRWPGRVSL